MTEEQYCHQVLAELRRNYEQAAKPYIDRLVAIKRLELAPRVFINMEDLTAQQQAELMRAPYMRSNGQQEAKKKP